MNEKLIVPTRTGPAVDRARAREVNRRFGIDLPLDTLRTVTRLEREQERQAAPPAQKPHRASSATRRRRKAVRQARRVNR